MSYLVNSTEDRISRDRATILSIHVFFSILVLTDQNTQEFTIDTNPHTTNTKTVLNELSHE